MIDRLHQSSAVMSSIGHKQPCVPLKHVYVCMTFDISGRQTVSPRSASLDVEIICYYRKNISRKRGSEALSYQCCELYQYDVCNQQPKRNILYMQHKIPSSSYYEQKLNVPLDLHKNESIFPRCKIYNAYWQHFFHPCRLPLNTQHWRRREIRMSNWQHFHLTLPIENKRQLGCVFYKFYYD